MNRRNAMAALSGAVAGSALLAVSGRAVAQQTPPGAAAKVAPEPVAAGQTLGASAYKQHTLTAGTFAKQTSMLALSRAQHPKVKQFAKFEADEQTAIAQTLTDAANPPPAPLDAAHQQKLATLNAAEGRDFDRAYVAGQIEGHNELLAIQKAFLSGQGNGGGKNRDLDHIAILARSVITMHLVMLEDLQAAVST